LLKECTEEPPYSMGTIARLSSFSPSLLRAWERRYDLIYPSRGAGGHRLYSRDDLFVLQSVKSYLNSGRSIGEVAVIGRVALIAQACQREAHAAAAAYTSGAGRHDDTELELLLREASPSLRAALADCFEARHSVGIEALRQSILTAASTYSVEGMRKAVDDVFAALSVERAIYEVLLPTLRHIGELWAEGRLGVAAEHVATRCITARLEALYEALRSASATGPCVVAASLPGEQHLIGTLLVAHSLAAEGLRPLYLAGGMPLDDIGAACLGVRARGLCLSVMRPEVFAAARQELLEFCRRSAGELEVVLGGEGAPESDAELEATGLVIWAGGGRLDKLGAHFA
jgi:MerR family transcriptional regulator, light-induced transcriptional regulator